MQKKKLRFNYLCSKLCLRFTCWKNYIDFKHLLLNRIDILKSFRISFILLLVYGISLASFISVLSIEIFRFNVFLNCSAPTAIKDSGKVTVDGIKGEETVKCWKISGRTKAEKEKKKKVTIENGSNFAIYSNVNLVFSTGQGETDW